MPSPRPLHLILAIIALVAIALPLAVIRYAPAPPPLRAKIVLPKRIVAKTELPPVEPVALVDLAPQDARAFNAGVPFVKGPIPAARPFSFAGSADEIARATDCLAAAVYYEAGDDAIGERAVAQVVLNRLRHPAFPKTVCGVVFQGQERSTGCQFTFTCDGALARTPGDAAWTRAREIAASALRGAVFRKVGLATHYHTDWVVPYWSASLDKIAAVDTHLFFRWSGWWGTPPAFNRGQAGSEPVVAALARISTEHGLANALAGADTTLPAAARYSGPVPLALASDPDTFIVALDPKAAPDSWRTMALVACGDRPQCKLLGWTDRGLMPVTANLLPNQLDAMSFSYLRNRESGLERTLWNCVVYPRAAKNECMKRQLPRIGELPASVPVTIPLVVPTRGPADLVGVRRNAPPPEAQSSPQPPAAPVTAPPR